MHSRDKPVVVSLPVRGVALDGRDRGRAYTVRVSSLEVITRTSRAEHTASPKPRPQAVVRAGTGTRAVRSSRLKN